VERDASSSPRGVAGQPWRTGFEVSTVTARATPPARANAVASRLDPRARTAASTRPQVSSFTFGGPLMSLETVGWETPAACATARMPTGLRRPGEGAVWPSKLV
jgi:hypothetical protein